MATQIASAVDAAATWQYIQHYPDPLLCVLVANLYYPGSPYRCEFDWFLWKLSVLR